MLWSSAATLLLAAAACTEETPVEVRQGTEFLKASSAVYDGKTGTYSVDSSSFRRSVHDLIFGYGTLRRERSRLD